MAAAEPQKQILTSFAAEFHSSSPDERVLAAAAVAHSSCENFPTGAIAYCISRSFVLDEAQGRPWVYT